MSFNAKQKTSKFSTNIEFFTNDYLHPDLGFVTPYNRQKILLSDDSKNSRDLRYLVFKPDVNRADSFVDLKRNEYVLTLMDAVDEKD